jgi:hypothetical protein
MDCDKHLLNVHWKHHHWVRHVTSTEDYITREADMWGRPVENEQVMCHVTHVCSTCGATRDGGDCGCDKCKGDRCAPRIACLDAEPERAHADVEKPAV